jgi:hypothetical protein
MGVKEERRRWAEASRRGDGAAEVDGAAEERGRHGCCRERPAGANRGIRRRATLCRRIASNSSAAQKTTSGCGRRVSTPPIMRAPVLLYVS